MKILAKIAGGSHLYGLNTPASDYDERYIFAYNDIGNIIGLDKNDTVDERDNGQDKLGYEVRRFLELCKKTNTQVVEFLFAPEEKFIELHPMFKRMRENKMKLINQDQFYKSMRGYIQGEKRLANGERTGDLGGKRKEALDKYGFSPKNFCQLIRLAYCGIEFFRNGNYPVDTRAWNPEVADYLVRLKTEPGAFSKEDLNRIVNALDAELEVEYKRVCETGKIISTYDHAIANKLLFQIYYPILGRLMAEDYDL